MGLSGIPGMKIVCISFLCSYVITQMQYFARVLKDYSTERANDEPGVRNCAKIAYGLWQGVFAQLLNGVAIENGP